MNLPVPALAAPAHTPPAVDVGTPVVTPLPVPMPGPLEFGRALLGLGLLGLVATLGGDVSGAPSGLVSGVGALTLTVPALLVAHPFLALRASPQALLAAIARPFTRVGDVALGLAPTLLVFRATSGLAPALLALSLLALAILGFSLATRHLVEAERLATADLWSLGKTTALVWAWSGLAFLIGARLAVGFL